MFQVLIGRWFYDPFLVICKHKFFFFQALRKVEEALRGRHDSRLKDMDNMGVFNHTGPNEALNALHNKVSWKI